MLMSYIPGIIGNYALNLNQPGHYLWQPPPGHCAGPRSHPLLPRWAASLLDFPAQGEDAMDGPPPPPPAPRRNPVGGPPPHPAACLPDAWQRPIVSDARRWIWGVNKNILNYFPFLASLIIESKDIP